MERHERKKILEPYLDASTPTHFLEEKCRALAWEMFIMAQELELIQNRVLLGVSFA
jgi:hypothetical protein